MRPSLLTLAVLCAACGGQSGATGDATRSGADDSTSGTDAGLVTDGRLDALAPDAPPPLSPVVDLRGDVNRDGVVDLADPADDLDEESWDAQHGAIFLANIDDDQQACPPPSSSRSDDELDACHDAADAIINGSADREDLATLRIAPWPDAPDDAVASISLVLPNAAPGTDPSTVVRVFKIAGLGFRVLDADERLDAQELREGAELAVEGIDIVRDAKLWDGFVDVVLVVEYPERGQTVTARDTVRMRIAPVLTSHHLQPAQYVFVSSGYGSASKQFGDAVGQAVKAAGVSGGLYKVQTDDQWTQDFFETGWMSMPAADGQQHVVKVLFRSANIDGSPSGKAPLRYAGRLVYDLRGPDVAAVRQVDLKRPNGMDTLNSFGNLETVPPYEHDGKSYPFGRVMMGNIPSYHPDSSLTGMLESQRQQPPIWIDTSWLLVGHVDETISFLPAANPRGWVIAVNDAELARKMLQDASDAGHGAVEMFIGKAWSQGNKEISAAVTIDEVLGDSEVMASSAEAVVEVKAQLAILIKETGVTEAELVRVPFLHQPIGGYSVAFNPGTVNGTLLADGHFAAPDPHGPVIDGEDIFKKQLTDAFAEHAITVHYIEDWDLYHRLDGEVHCGTNALRAVPQGLRWWESGR